MILFVLPALRSENNHIQSALQGRKRALFGRMKKIAYVPWKKGTFVSGDVPSLGA